MHLIVEDAIVSVIPDLLPVMLEAWPGTSGLVSSATLSDCLTAMASGTVDAALVRLHGFKATGIGKVSAVPLLTSLEGTLLLHRARWRDDMFVRLRDVAKGSGQTGR